MHTVIYVNNKCIHRYRFLDFSRQFECYSWHFVFDDCTCEYLWVQGKSKHWFCFWFKAHKTFGETLLTTWNHGQFFFSAAVSLKAVFGGIQKTPGRSCLQSWCIAHDFSPPQSRSESVKKRGDFPFGFLLELKEAMGFLSCFVHLAIMSLWRHRFC